MWILLTLLFLYVFITCLVLPIWYLRSRIKTGVVTLGELLCFFFLIITGPVTIPFIYAILVADQNKLDFSLDPFYRHGKVIWKSIDFQTREAFGMVELKRRSIDYEYAVLGLLAILTVVLIYYWCSYLLLVFRAFL